MHEECPEPYEGIRELINTLKKEGILVALITGKGEKSCRITLEQFGMQDLFCSVKTGAEDRPNKAEAIGELLHDCHLAKDEFYYVGDAVSDGQSCRLQESGRDLPVRRLGNYRGHPRPGRSQPFKCIFQHQGPVAFPAPDAGKHITCSAFFHLP